VLARPVAIKLPQAQQARHAETLDLFRAEARNAGAVSHPGIAQVYDYGDAGPGHPPYLVMELVDGPSLADLIAGGPLDPAQAMDVVAQTAAGLHAAHLAGLLRGTPLEVARAHRDRAVPPLPATVPPQMAALVTDLTAREPAARPGNAGEVAARAGRLRDRVSADTAMLRGADPDPLAVTLTALQLPPPPPARGLPWGGRLSSRAAMLAAAAAVVVGLFGFLLAGVLNSAPRGLAAVPSASAPPRTATAARMVEVNGGSLTGQPIGAVHRQLRQLGLVVRVSWQPSDQQPGGTVLSVQPGGLVPAGSTVTVTAALQAHRNGQGNDDGNGKGHGDGGDGGG
jgi:hypothetical protein